MKHTKYVVTFLVLVATFIFTILPVSAQVGFCDLVPCNENITDVTASSTLSLGLRIALLVVGLIFTVFIAAGVFFILKAGLKIIRSEGDPSQIEGAVKIMKGVYAGVIILILGVVGLAIILGILQSGQITATPITEPAGITLPPVTP